MEDFATALLPEALRRFRESYPATKLTVQSALTAELQQELAAGNLDLIIARQNETCGNGEVLWTEPLHWVSALNMPLGKGPIPLVMFPPECVYRAEILDRLRSKGVCWEVVYTSTSLAGVQAAVSAGVGVSVAVSQRVV